MSAEIVFKDGEGGMFSMKNVGILEKEMMICLGLKSKNMNNTRQVGIVGWSALPVGTVYCHKFLPHAMSSL